MVLLVSVSPCLGGGLDSRHQNQNLSQNHAMDTITLDPRVSVFGSVAEESSYNAWLSAELDKRAADKRLGIPHDQVGANLAELLSQLRKTVA